MGDVGKPMYEIRVTGSFLVAGSLSVVTTNKIRRTRKYFNDSCLRVTKVCIAYVYGKLIPTHRIISNGILFGLVIF
jgi:hypothetical protein